MSSFNGYISGSMIIIVIIVVVIINIVHLKNQQSQKYINATTRLTARPARWQALLDWPAQADRSAGSPSFKARRDGDQCYTKSSPSLSRLMVLWYLYCLKLFWIFLAAQFSISSSLTASGRRQMVNVVSDTEINKKWIRNLCKILSDRDE